MKRRFQSLDGGLAHLERLADGFGAFASVRFQNNQAAQGNAWRRIARFDPAFQLLNLRFAHGDL
jgi:hypothetical protein